MKVKCPCGNETFEIYRERTEAHPRLVVRGVVKETVKEVTTHETIRCVECKTVLMTITESEYLKQ